MSAKRSDVSCHSYGKGSLEAILKIGPSDYYIVIVIVLSPSLKTVSVAKLVQIAHQGKPFQR